jgi:hypothetical protein
LKIGRIAVLDLDNHTALHLEVIKTLPLESEKLLKFYAFVVEGGYFSKEPLMSQLVDSCEFDIISFGMMYDYAISHKQKS